MNKIIGITGLLFIVIVGLGLYVNSTKEKIAPVDASEVLEIQETDHVSGDRNSDVVIVEYLDLQCPACAAYHPIIDEVKAANPDIAIVTRHFPLAFHRNARAAAGAAEAAANQGQFEQMVTKLFEGQALWSPLGAGAADDVFERYAQELGLDMDAFNSDRNSSVARAKVEADYSGGLAAGVNSTPTFLLQGQRVQPRSAAEFQTIIDEAWSLAVDTPAQEVEEVVETVDPSGE